MPNGRFQRAQDHIIRLVNHPGSARWLRWEALWKLDTDQPGARASAHMAKAVASEAYPGSDPLWRDRRMADALGR